MGKKKNKGFNCLRPIFGFGNYSYSLFRKLHTKPSASLSWSLKGFTLVELIIVTGILGVLAGFIFFALNPFAQLEKAKDAQRQNDIKAIQTAADTYYNDINCYPQELTSAYLNPAYIKNIPNDPSGGSYIYTADPALCPQWNVLFAKLNRTSATSISCALEQYPGNCLPINYSELGYNFCVVSGDVNCADIANYTIPTTPGSSSTPTPTTPSGPTATPTPSGPTATPTPTPVSNICTGQIYAYTSGNNCNALGNPADCDFINGGNNYICYQNRTGSTCENPICTGYQ